mmetsp:Transcript_52651/g.153475  ORF Transcript_52651/g.153475 Transcript_52651/m.153475 type:complete len:316 (-) Transcript_52651:330-1277(-)
MLHKVRHDPPHEAPVGMVLILAHLRLDDAGNWLERLCHARTAAPALQALVNDQLVSGGSGELLPAQLRRELTQDLRQLWRRLPGRLEEGRQRLAHRGLTPEIAGLAPADAVDVAIDVSVRIPLLAHRFFAVFHRRGPEPLGANLDLRRDFLAVRKHHVRSSVLVQHCALDHRDKSFEENPAAVPRRDRVDAAERVPLHAHDHVRTVVVLILHVLFDLSERVDLLPSDRGHAVERRRAHAGSVSGAPPRFVPDSTQQRIQGVLLLVDGAVCGNDLDPFANLGDHRAREVANLQFVHVGLTRNLLDEPVEMDCAVTH